MKPRNAMANRKNKKRRFQIEENAFNDVVSGLLHVPQRGDRLDAKASARGTKRALDFFRASRWISGQKINTK